MKPARGRPWNVWSARGQTLAVGARRRKFPDQELPRQLESGPFPPSHQQLGHPGMYCQVGTFVCNEGHSENLRQHSTIVMQSTQIYRSDTFPTESFTSMPNWSMQAESFLSTENTWFSARTKCFDAPLFVRKMCEVLQVYLLDLYLNCAQMDLNNLVNSSLFFNKF